MKRRDFLCGTGAALAAMALNPRAARAQTGKGRLNILFMITDQQFADGMSCRMGNRYIHTPGMDRLAKNGMLFERAYTPNPLCQPARTSIFSGHYPHQTGVQTNDKGGRGHEKYPCLGTYFAKSGYRTAYFGKWHTAYDLNDPEVSGFQFVDESGRSSTANLEKFLEEKQDAPFMAVASFINPHDICEWSRFQRIKSGALGEAPALDKRPPLPPNHAPPKNETDVMAFMRKSYQAHRLFPLGRYEEDEWRRLSWGYYRLIERVDAHIVRVLDTLDKTGLVGNTVVILTSDHGDCHGAHRWNQKTVFYDESARIPLILSCPGQPTRGETSKDLVNTGVDLGPTMLDFAGIAVPAHMPGKSLRPAAEGKVTPGARDYIVIQNHMVQCEPVDGLNWKPQGRMVRSKRYKYCVYSEGERRESLVDMERDPGETVNRAGDPALRDTLLQHRKYLAEFAAKQGDDTALAILAALRAG